MAFHDFDRRKVRLLWLATLAILVGGSAVEAGAGRTRPGGRSGGGSAQRATGRASYGHGVHHGHHHHGHHYRYGHGFGYGLYGHLAWPWGFWYAGWPYAGLQQPIDPDAAAAIEIDVQPARAEILLDGQFVGQARDYNGRWDLLWLEPGEHVLEFSREGYQTLRRDVDLPAGGYARIGDRLRKGSGLDDRSSAVLAGGASEPAGSEPAPAPPQALRRGLLRLVVEPADAAVYLDGEFLARADELAALRGALPVAEGEHTVEVVRPGHESRQVVVLISGEQPTRVEIRLERK